MFHSIIFVDVDHRSVASIAPRGFGVYRADAREKNKSFSDLETLNKEMQNGSSIDITTGTPLRRQSRVLSK